jgi:hypothetical protein
MQPTARRLSVVSATSCARRRLIRGVRRRYAVTVMKTILLRILFGIASLLLITSCATDYSRREAAKGRSDARNDLRAGKLANEGFGLPASWASTYDRLLRQRYGVESRSVAGCVVTSEIVGHAVGYNEVMDAEIKRRFGADVFERTAAEAERIGPHRYK